jgi:hypothetical protein
MAFEGPATSTIFGDGGNTVIERNARVAGEMILGLGVDATVMGGGR